MIGWLNLLSSLTKWLEETNAEYESIKHYEASAAWNTSVLITPENQEIYKAAQDLK